jgi:hypothetical protein
VILKNSPLLKIIGAIKQNQQESRKELLLWLFERAGRKAATTKNISYGSRIAIQ